MRLMALLAILIMTGCATREPWRYARPTCLQLANAAFIEASFAGYDAGVVHCFVDGQPHAVTFIRTEQGLRLWDATIGRYRAQDELGEPTLWIQGRPSLGAWEVAR